MSICLFQHNQIAYDAALSMLAETGKAAIIHPTGTGKSFIGFKLCADNPNVTICWMSPSEYIFATQLENWRKAGGGELSNIAFFTYAKLMNMSKAEISEIQPSFIVLDEFHRAGAEFWGQGVQNLLDVYAEVPVLGLSATAIRYLDNQRDMADELFDGNVASEITLGEAIVRGILMPPKYVLSVFSYQRDLERYQRRVEKSQSPWAKDKATQYLDALKRALEKADGLDVIFEKHMTNRTGKYIVFCANFDHMKEMMSKSQEWFGKIDANPHIYSVYSYDPSASQSFIDFKSDADDTHLRLLYCIDALNEGIHVDDVSGVILLRPTVSPIIYKQQIGRAMSAGKSGEAVIFDIVANISGLYSIDSIQDEMNTAIEYYRYLGNEGSIVNENFRVFDEVQNCKTLFDALEHTLSASWEQMFEMAKAYYEENGDLLPPSSYTTEEGYHLGQWIVTQRVSHNKKDPVLTPDRIAKLESIGMSWLTLHERFWEESYAIVKAFYEKHGSLEGLYGYSTKAYSWILMQRQKYRTEQLTKDQIQLLNAVGMVWEPEDTWQAKYEAACEYYRVHGNLDIPANYVNPNGIPLGGWYRSVRNQHRDGTLSEERIRMLESIGINWISVKTRTWMRYYDEAKSYFDVYGNTDITSSYVSNSGLRLGIWVSSQRYAYSKGKLPQEQIDMLERIHFSWQRDDSRWEVGFSYLKKYWRMNGNANVPNGYVTAEGFELGKWATAQRARRKQGKVSAARIAKLDALNFCWEPNEAAWQDGYSHAKTYYSLYGNLNVPASYTDEDGFKLGAWISNKRTHYRKGSLSEERISQLERIGMVWDRLDEIWQTGYIHAADYYAKFGHLNVPQGYIAPDGYSLSNWLTNIKKKQKDGKLSVSQFEQLQRIGFLQKEKQKRVPYGAEEQVREQAV